MLGAVRTKHRLRHVGFDHDFSGGELKSVALERTACGAHLDVSVQSAGTLGAVRDPVGLLVDGSQARRRGRGVLGVTLHPGEQDAAQGGLGGRVQHQLGGKAWKHTSATRHQVKQGWTEFSFLWTKKRIFTQLNFSCA